MTNLSSPAKTTSSHLDAAGPSVNTVDDHSHDERIRRESIVWKYATRNLDNQTATCIKCEAVIKTTNWSTTGLRKHLIQIHKITTIPPSAPAKKATFPPALRKELHELAIKAIIQDSRSFNDFRRSGMLKFLKKAVPGAYPISHDRHRVYCDRTMLK